MLKMPFKKSKANAYMKYNELKKRERSKVKKLGKREFRRFQKSILIEEIEFAKNGN